MTAIQLRAKLLSELNPIFDSEVAMQKALTALRSISRVVFTEVPTATATPRKGWATAARKAHKQGDDQLVAADIFDEEKDCFALYRRAAGFARCSSADVLRIV